MSSIETIRHAFKRTVRALERRPDIGQGTAVTTVRVRDGLTCEVEEGAWRLLVDMPEKSGGNNAGPNPGILGRAALGTCLAMGYTRWAAVFGLHLADVTVEVQADYDARGEYGVADLPPGYAQVRYIVTLESDAPEADLRRLIDVADAHTAFLDVFQRPIDVRREVQIVAPAEVAP